MSTTDWPLCTDM